MPCHASGSAHGQAGGVAGGRRRPSRASRSGSAAPAWVVVAGQSGTRHLPAGDQRRGQERRGVGQVGLDDDVAGRDRAGRDPPQVGRAVVDVDAGRSRSIGDRHGDVRQGRQRRPPRGAGRARRRSGRRPAAARSRTGDDAEASIVTVPPGTRPVPWTVRGTARRPPSSIRTPSVRRAASSGPSGRSRARGSPSKRTGPWASAATAGTNRRTVPASPTSTSAGPRSGAGVTTQSPAPSAGSDARSVTSVPRAVRARTIRVGVAGPQRPPDP